MITQHHELMFDTLVERGVLLPRQENRRWNTFIRNRSPESFKNPNKSYYLRVRGLPYEARENEILEFLKGIRVKREDIYFLYDYEGKFSGEAYLKVYNESDMREAISFSKGKVGGRVVEVLETTENEYI